MFYVLIYKYCEKDNATLSLMIFNYVSIIGEIVSLREINTSEICVSTK